MKRQHKPFDNIANLKGKTSNQLQVLLAWYSGKFLEDVRTRAIAVNQMATIKAIMAERIGRK